MMYQQGDVLLTKIENLPDGGKKHSNVLAEGEATGHTHRATGENVAVLEGEKEELFLSAPSGATIVHEEHKTLEVPPGYYRVRQVREYDHFEEEARRVQD